MSQRKNVAVVTGASAGLGKATAHALASAGWTVIGLGRNPIHCQNALSEIREQAPEAQVHMVTADLAILAEARRAADEIASLTDRIDVLINNAGGIGSALNVTAEGNEAIFAGNHLGPFLLTRALLPLLRRAAAQHPANRVRVVCVSSAAADNSQGFDWSDPQLMSNYVAYQAYANAKLANLMFTRGLAKRLAEDGIAAYAMHPGIASTNFADHGDEALQQSLRGYADITVSAEEGADTLIWLATTKEVGHPSGSYFYQRKPVEMNPIAHDEWAVERLWKESEAIIARSLSQ